MQGTREAAEAAAPAARDRNPDIVLAFDFGLRRIGVAAGNLLTRTASGVTTLDTRRGTPPWDEIDALLAGFAPSTLVVGMPQPSSAPTPVLARVRDFAAALASRYDLPVESVDETLTSREAEAEIRAARRGGALRKRQGKRGVDARAARLIAEQWMHEQPPPRRSP